jgi:hypothetical protein
MSDATVSAPPPLPLPLAEGPPPRRVWRTVESTMGAFFAFVVGFVLIVTGANAAYLTAGTPQFVPVLATAVVLVAAELWGLARLKHALESGVHPVAPNLALAQPRWPLLVHPVVFAWWLAHYAVGIAAVVLLERHFPLASDDWREAAVRWAGYAGCLFTTTHSACLYLLLAVATVIRRPGPVAWLWRWRVAIDLLIGLGVTAPRLLGH